MDTNNKSVILVGRSDKEGEPSPFKIISSKHQATQNDIITLKVKCFSVDPVMRVWMSGAQTYYPAVKLNSLFHTFGVGEVIESKTDLYKKGDLVFGNTGCTQMISIEKDSQRFQTLTYIPQQLIANFTPQQFIYLTNNGVTAYEGIDIMNVKQGQTVVVSTAAGATGLIVCQMLKFRGIKVIGLTSPKKLKLIQKYCDVVVNYQNKQQLISVLKKHKFKYYFDNVGQWLLDLILLYIQPFGVISLCGATANYRNFKQRQGIKNYSLAVTKRLSIKGFNFGMAFYKIFDAYEYFRKMRKANKLQLMIETIDIDDFQKGYLKLMKGQNIGKIIVSNNNAKPKL